MEVLGIGQLSFGVVFEKGFEFPWDNEEFKGDIEEWWLSVQGFVNPWTSAYKDFDVYKPGMISRNAIAHQWHNSRYTWIKQNPMPVEVINYCSDHCPMYILASKHIENKRGCPVKLDLDFIQDIEEPTQALVSFLQEFGIETEESPRWWLSSYCDE